MRHFSLLIGKDIRGPLTEDEIKVMIDDGSLAADTPCAPEGAQAWTPLSDHFNFGAKLKIKRTKDVSTEAEDQAASTRIDPDLRKKLLIYGLADATSVDGFTHVQAAAAVTARESLIRSQLRRVRVSMLLSLMIAIPLSLLSGLFIPMVESALSALTSNAIVERGSARTELAGCRQGIKQMKWSMEKVKSLTFAPPYGGTTVGEDVVNRLRISHEKSFFLNGRIGIEKLSKAFSKKGSPLYLKGGHVHLLKEMPSGRLLELLNGSEDSLKNPVDEGRNGWPAFQKANGKELEKLVKHSTLISTTVDVNNGEFKFESIPPINPTMARQVVIELHARGEKAFVTYSAPILEQISWDGEPLDQSIYITKEQYYVVRKLSVGNKTYKAVISSPYHSFQMTRTSLTWNYACIARKYDTDELYVLMSDEDQFNNTQVGELFDHQKNSGLRCLSMPAESPVPPGLE